MLKHTYIKCGAEFTGKEDSSCVRCGGLTEVRPETEEEKTRRLYLQQQARLACPGCGEEQFLG